MHGDARRRILRIGTRGCSHGESELFFYFILGPLQCQTRLYCTQRRIEIFPLWYGTLPCWLMWYLMPWAGILGEYLTVGFGGKPSMKYGQVPQHYFVFLSYFLSSFLLSFFPILTSSTSLHLPFLLFFATRTGMRRDAYHTHSSSPIATSGSFCLPRPWRLSGESSPQWRFQWKSQKARGPSTESPPLPQA